MHSKLPKIQASMIFLWILCSMHGSSFHANDNNPGAFSFIKPSGGGPHRVCFCKATTGGPAWLSSYSLIYRRMSLKIQSV